MSRQTGTLELPLTDPRAYDAADRFCDVVMKGCITSGVAYPLAVC